MSNRLNTHLSKTASSSKLKDKEKIGRIKNTIFFTISTIRFYILWLLWVIDREESLNMILSISNTIWLDNNEKMIFFKIPGFTFDMQVKEWLLMNDSERLERWLPASTDKKIFALISLTKEEREVLWLNDYYKEFLKLLDDKLY